MGLFGFLSNGNINNSETYSKIKFKDEVERLLFHKYMELGEKNGWTSITRMVKGGYFNSDIPQEISSYENKERKYIHIIGIDGCIGTAYREWDSHRNKGDWRGKRFDVIDNESVVDYIFEVADAYQAKQDAIIKEEEDAKKKKERIEQRNIEEQKRIELYTKRMQELNGVTNEFSGQFKILREIENIGKLNAELMDSWKNNINKIYKLRQEFYNIT